MPTLRINSPTPPPPWALLQRALITANDQHTHEFHHRYFDHRGYLLCVERWGALDGPDDAIENLTDVPALYLLGGADDLVEICHRCQEGHLRQYTEARTTEVEFAREGMYYREFPVMFDWAHHQEGNAVVTTIGLCDPGNDAHIVRLKRFAGFYMENDDEPSNLASDRTAPNWDPEHKIIRSMFTGSRGSLLRKTTPLDWAGDRIEDGRFFLAHGERHYQDMLDHYIGYEDVVGDHPLNLAATCMAFNAYAHTGERRYRDWLLGYADAWVARTAHNDGIIPSNIGLDGSIGGETDGKWYGGCYGWSHTTLGPVHGELKHRNGCSRCVDGFGNAVLLTGQAEKYAMPWRTTLQALRAAAKEIDGRTQYPTMHGDEGWYAWQEEPEARRARDVYLWTLAAEDRELVGADESRWLEYLEGTRPDYPVETLQTELEQVRAKVHAMRNDCTTPDTRLSDNPNSFRPASVSSLMELAMGSPRPEVGGPIHSRLRYFDLHRGRPGLPADVGALVDRITVNSTEVQLVNLNQLEERVVVVQAGTYGENNWTTAQVSGVEQEIGRHALTIALAPGCGAHLTLGTDRYANQPSARFPWMP